MHVQIVDKIVMSSHDIIDIIKLLTEGRVGVGVGFLPFCSSRSLNKAIPRAWHLRTETGVNTVRTCYLYQVKRHPSPSASYLY